MRVIISECASLFWTGGKLIWDDYVNHRQFSLSAEAERVIRWFSIYRELDTVRTLDDSFLSIATQLVDAGILIKENSDAAREEARLLAAWGDWGARARH